MKNTKIELTDNLIGIQGLGTYHGYFNPDYILNDELINEDFEEGITKFTPDQYWESLFCWDLYANKLKGLIDNELHWLTDHFNELLDGSIIQIDCVGIDSPKYYNYRDDHWNLDFIVTDQFFDVCKKFAENNFGEFNKYLKDNSYDGFVSYTANNYDTWLIDFNKGGETAIGAFLSYLYNCHINFNFVEHCLQNNEIYYWDCIKEGGEVWD